MEGDRADRKGALTGGYHDVRRSRLDAVKAVKKWREAFESDSSRHAEVKEGISRLEQQISTAMGQVQVLEAKRKQILNSRAMVAAQAQSSAREEEHLRQRVSRLETSLNGAESELRSATAKRTSYEAELKTPMTQKLSDADIASLERLTRKAEEQKEALMKLSTARQKVRRILW